MTWPPLPRVGGHPAAAGAIAEGKRRGIAGDHGDPVELHAQLSGGDLRHGGLVPCPCEDTPMMTCTLPPRHAHIGALEGPTPVPWT